MTNAPRSGIRAGQTDGLVEAMGILSIVVAAVWWMAPVLLNDGWPMNHEALPLFERVEGIRRELLHGTWYPTWAPSLENGYGSPFPLFYHRLFSTLAAVLAIPLGSVLMSVKLLTTLLLMTGALGMRQLLHVSGASEPWTVTGALLFLLAPYVLIDWHVRGAAAELTAFMILPWLYAELCEFIQGQRNWIASAILIVLLFHAHSVICYYFLLSLVVFLLLTLTRGNRLMVWSGVRREWPRIVVAGLIASIGIIPQAIVAGRLMHYFNTDALEKGVPGIPARIEENYRPLFQYFADSTFHWGAQWRGVSVEVNRFVSVALLVVLVLPGAAPYWRSALRTPLVLFVLLWTGLCLALQLPVTRPFFDLLPLARFLQFPWRLLVFLTIGQIFLFLSAARAAAGGETWERIVVVGCVGLTVLLTVIQFSPGRAMRDDPIPPALIAADLEKLNGALSVGEYRPKGFDSSVTLPDREFLVAQGCRNAVHVETGLETGELRATADEPGACTISLRQFQTPLLFVEVDNGKVISTTPSREIRIALNEGRSGIRLRARTFWELLGWVLSHRA